MSKPLIKLGVILNLQSKNAIVTDETDYTALGINDNDIKIALRIVTPIGEVYKNLSYNNPNIAPDLYSGNRNKTLTFDLITNNTFITGTYTIYAKVYDGSDSSIYDYEFSENVTYEKKCIKTEQVVNCFLPKFTSRDKTDYSNSTMESYLQTIHYPTITHEPDSTYGYYYFTENRLANGVYTVEIETERYWHYGIIDVFDKLHSTKDYAVDCGVLCDVRCAFNNLFDMNKKYCGVDKKKADETQKLLSEATVFMSAINLNLSCGKFNKADDYLLKLKALLGDCDCDCNEEKDIWVTGLGDTVMGDNFDYVFQSCNELLEISSSENNGVITLTFCINQQKILELIPDVDVAFFTELNVACLGTGFPTEGTETQKRQWFIDKICEGISSNPSMTNLGDGVGVYKSFNSNAYELKSLKKSVIQPTNPDMLSGNVAVNIKNNTNDIEFEFDFSTLKVASMPAEGSIKTYYVFQTTSNAYVGDGSVSRPYKNWTDCKTAIIGTGDFTAPQNNNSRVVFLNNITSNESLTVNTLIYEFRNSSIFNYKPVASETLDDAVIDFQKIINTSSSVGIDIKLTGTGTITREDTTNTSKQIIVKHKGGSDGINRVLYFTENCNITLQEKKQPINLFTPCINPDTALPLTASNGVPIYVVNNDLPMPEGLFSCIDSNNSTTSEVYIRLGSTLNIVTNTQVGIYNSGSSIQNYGTITFSNQRPPSGVLMRYNSIDVTIPTPYNGRYTPHLGLSMIKLLNNGTFSTLSSGAIYYNLSGYIKQGGFNSFVEIDNGKFTSTSNIGFIFEFFAYFNSIFRLKGSGTNNIDIKRINTNLQPRQNIFSADSSAESVANTIKIYYGVIELLTSYAQNDTIFSSSTLKGNTTLKTTDLTLSGLLMYDFISMPTALSVGFSNYPKGTLYRKQDVDNEWVLCIKS